MVRRLKAGFQKRFNFGRVRKNRQTADSVHVADVARDFPGLKLVAFHMGYPYSDDLNLVAMGHPNVYLCLSLLVPWAITAPYKFARILGEAIRFAGPDRIIWGTDSAGYGAQIGAAVLGLRDFQIPEELQWQYGYLPLTDDDKRKMFGGNLAGLLGIDPTVRRIGQPSGGATPIPVAMPQKEMSAPDNTYDVVVSSPMGDLPGKAVLKIDGNSLSGTLSLLNHANPFSGGSFEDGKVVFKGELKTPVGNMAYTVTGTLIDGKIEAVAKTKMGELLIRSK
ncbi:MAG TPA: amidohydrolase family protein [Anaerolineales bacterium]|nr:amidohydrolase family protein [Anaerolineales bacterium]